MTPPSRLHDPYAALRIPDFRRLLAAAMLATIAAEMQNVALGWELYERTRSPLALGFVGLAIVVPVLLLALPAGHAADRYPRKRIMIAAQVLLGLASVLLWMAAHIRWPVATVYAILCLTGTAIATALPARAAILPQLVPLDLLPNAITWRTSGWQLSAVAGPALGGLGVAVFREAKPVFALSACVSIVVVCLLARLRPRVVALRREPITLGSMLAGIRFVARSDVLLAAITLDMFAVLLGGATFLLPVFSRDILAIGPAGLGWLRAAPSIGAAAMALVIAHRPPLRRAGPTLLTSVAGFGIATVLFGISRNAYLSFALLLLIGALDNISVVIRGTILQLLTPDAMRGRVSAVNSVFVNLSNELGGFESGVTAAWWGPTRSVVFGGLGCLAVVMGAAMRWPALVRLDRLTALGGPEHGHQAEEALASQAKTTRAPAPMRVVDPTGLDG
jgi:MFS family permease